MEQRVTEAHRVLDAFQSIKVKKFDVTLTTIKGQFFEFHR